MVAKVELLLEKYRVKNPVDELTEDQLSALSDEQKTEIESLATSESFRKRVAYYKKDKTTGKYVLDENGRRIPVTYGEIFDDTSNDVDAYGVACIYYKRKIAIKFQAYIEQHDYMETKPELAEWAQYSYEEILEMEANGVLIPEEALEWAHSMQDSEATDGLFDEELMELLGENTGDMELLQLQKKALGFGIKSEKAEEETKVKQTELRETADKASNLKREQEGTVKDSLKEIDELTKEWNDLTKKVKDGKKLSSAEKNRYKELAGLLNGEDGKLTTQIQASNDDLDNLMKMMDGLEVDITENIELGEDTVDAAKELAKYEKTHKVVTTETNMNPAIETVNTSITDARGQNISVEAQAKGNSLIDFSNNLDNTLMSAQYTALYAFSQVYTEQSEEVLDKTKEAMGSDFNKSKEDLEKEIDALPSMNKAEEDQARLREQGGRLGLLREAAYFGGMSVKYAALSTGAIIDTQIAAAISIVQLAKSEKITKDVEAAVKHINERREYLEEKQAEAERVRQEQEQKIRQHVDELVEKAKDGDEDARAELQEMAANKDTIAAMVEAVCQMIFSENDKAELETLDDVILEIGQDSQEKLDKAFKTNEQAGAKLPEYKELAQDSIDYGVISAQDGAQILAQYYILMAISPLLAYCAMSLFVIGMFAEISGVASMAAGGIEKGEANLATNLNQHTQQAILNDETQVETETQVAGISSVAADEEAEEEVETGETETTEEVEESEDDAEKETGIDENTDTEQQEEVQEEVGNANEATATITVGDDVPQQNEGVTEEEEETGDPVEGVEGENEEGTEEFNIAEYIQDKADDVEKQKEKEGEADEVGNGDDEQSEGAGLIGKTKKALDDVKDDNADTKVKDKEAQKDEDKLKKEQAKVEKENERLNKKIEALAKDSQEKANEKQMLNEEYNVLSEQNIKINQQVMAAQAKQQQQATQPQQGGLVSPAGGAGMGDQQQNIATLTVNQTRMEAITARSEFLDTKIAKNTKAVYKNRSKIVKNTQRLKKIAKEKMKIQREHEKAEKAKQKRMEMRNAVMGVFKNIFTIISALGALFMVLSKIPVLSYLEVPGQILTYIGIAGSLLVAIVQGSIAIAEGDLAGGLMQIGMAVVQAAVTIATMGAGAGIGAAGQAAAEAASTAAQAATITVAEGFQAASACVSMVTATMDMTNDFIVIGGGERNQGLAMASQIMGMANSIMGLGAGMANGGYQQASQWLMMAGTLLSTTAQIGTMFAQLGEKDDGTWAQILGMVGSGLQIAGAVASLGETISAKTASSQSTGKKVEKSQKAAKDADTQVKKAEKVVKEIDAQIANAKDDSQKQSLMKQKQQAEKELNKAEQTAKKAHTKAKEAEKAHQEAQAREEHKAAKKAEKQAAKANRAKGNSNGGNTQNTDKPAEQPKPADSNPSPEANDPANNTDNQQTTDNAVAASDDTRKQQMKNEAKAKSVRELKNEIKGLKDDIKGLEGKLGSLTSGIQSEMDAKISALGENPSEADIQAIRKEYESKKEEIMSEAKNEALQKEYDNKKEQLEIDNQAKNEKIDFGMKTAEQVIKVTTQAAQIGTQIASAASAGKSTQEQQAKANLDLSSMEKTRALVKKIKRKNKAMAGGHR